MKKPLLFIVLVGLISGCASYYDRIIESDYSYSGKFSKYDSYDFMINAEAGVDDKNKELVEKFIGQRMRTLGFSYEEKKPSLIVSYKVFYDDFNMKGYAQPNFASYVNTNDRDAKLADNNKQTETEDISEFADYFNVGTTDAGFIDQKDLDYAAIDCEMNEGSLLITFFDRKAKKTVWQGYASGVVQRMDEERFLRHTVGKILDNYRVLARGFGVPN